ncbi:MAG: AmmeMemoRadiSam system protein B [Chloroflexota bacterium]
MSYPNKPKLRNINVERTVYQGEPVFFLQDRLKLTEAGIVLPQALGPVAMLCDGQHTVSEMEQALAQEYGLQLPRNSIEHLLDQFDHALLLEGSTFNQAKEKAIEQFRAAPFRKSTLAGPSYPADPDKLRQLLQSYLDNVEQTPSSTKQSRGIISPHIDYPRGGHVYAGVWANAAEAIREAELVVLFGTDHNGGLGTLTLTPQNYATPLGIMPTDTDLVNRLAETLGPETVFAEELHHRDEWSIELVLVWLQYLRKEKPCAFLPILCGSFHHIMMGQATIDDEPQFEAFLDILRAEMKQRRTVIVASGDLAHMGPAFDGSPLNTADYDQMVVDDAALMKAVGQGDAKAFLEFMQGKPYERNVCGLSPFYFTLNLLGESYGQTLSYDRCPADHQDTSFVSVCGMTLE